ncbi:MAG: hypothetical protein LN569_03785 [Rickettsia endosymbiont of Labidopullus appendiculatus]|nr:hypothetical protein [Rickettsia endosymbiont of Labidopullus appendiculatus]
MQKAVKSQTEGEKESTPLYSTFHELSLPENGAMVTLESWQEMIQQSRVQAMCLFKDADIIEAKKAELAGHIGYLPPKNMVEAEEILAQTKYKNATQNLELAFLCSIFHLREEIFDESLTVYQKKKHKDNLPNVHINSKDVTYLTPDGKLANYSEGYHLVKLPIDDPRVLLLGQFTQCCLWIDGIGRNVVTDGIQKENNGFYILLKKKARATTELFNEDGKINYEDYTIIGNAYAWIAKSGNLVFGWQNLSSQSNDNIRDAQVIVPMIKAFAQEVVKSGQISQIYIGISSHIPKTLQCAGTSIYEEKMREGQIDDDTTTQLLLMENEKLTNIKNGLKNHFPKGTDRLITINQAEKIQAIIQVLDNQGQNLFKMFKDNESLFNLITSYYGTPKTATFEFLEKLLALDSNSQRILTSNEATHAYKSGFVTIDDLMGLDINKMEALISNNAVASYQSGYVTLEKLITVDTNKIHALTSYVARWLYETKNTSFNKLKEYEAQKIAALVSVDTTIYENKHLIFAHLKNLSVDKIKVLVTEELQQAYQNGYLQANELENLDIQQIQALTTTEARKAYKTGMVKVNDLKDFDPEKIKALVSSDAIIGYKNEYFTVSDLATFTPVNKR